ncbi:MAG: TIR domain-containing protein [Sedimentisphaerales bacterium]|nr:TIR domain-containing protein [Sedimentisphaerales bacterium]
MANRTGTYIAFDGLGQTDPTKSDFKYYATIQAWAKNKDIDFKYVDSHDKTCAVRDTSLKETLKARIRERLSNSKNVVVILSSDTRKSGSMLSYEIEQAIDAYKLPLIIAYVDHNVVANVDQLSGYWPNALSSRIGNSVARAIHISFIKDAILDAIGQFNISKLPSTAKSYYSEQAHRNFGVLSLLSSFTNTKK